MSKEAPDGMPMEAVTPYLMDLGSTNGTYINNERLEPQRYYELLEQATPHPFLLDHFLACLQTSLSPHSVQGKVKGGSAKEISIFCWQRPGPHLMSPASVREAWASNRMIETAEGWIGSL